MRWLWRLSAGQPILGAGAAAIQYVAHQHQRREAGGPQLGSVQSARHVVWYKESRQARWMADHGHVRHLCPAFLVLPP